MMVVPTTLTKRDRISTQQDENAEQRSLNVEVHSSWDTVEVLRTPSNNSAEQERRHEEVIDDDHEVMTDLKQGMFVYQVVNSNGAAIHRHSRECVQAGTAHDDTEVQNRLEYGDIVQVDQLVVRTSTQESPSRKTQLLRLAHQRGWLIAEQMRALPTESGLWCWHIHPLAVDGGFEAVQLPKLGANEQAKNSLVLHQLQKIYCDRKFVDPITSKTFYRLQPLASLYGHHVDTTKQPSWWVCDSTPNDLPALLDESQVETDRLWVFSNNYNRSLPLHTNVPDVLRQTSESTNDATEIQPGDMVVVKAIIWSAPTIEGENKSDDTLKRRPFFKLADGSGWIVLPNETNQQQQEEHEYCLQQVPMIKCQRQLRVLREKGVDMWHHPSTRRDVDDPLLVQWTTDDSTSSNNDQSTRIHFEYDAVIKCDCRVTHPISRVSFYRVEGTDGWVANRHDAESKLSWLSRVVDSDGLCDSKSSSHYSWKEWNPEFVRGIAAAVPNLKELPSKSDALVFKTPRYTKIRVFCDDKTVSTEVSHPVFGAITKSQKNCTIEDMCSIFHRDTIETMMHMGSEVEGKEQKLEQQEVQEKEDDKEKEMRLELLKCENAIHVLLTKQQELVQKITFLDNERTRKMMLATQGSRDVVASVTKSAKGMETESGKMVTTVAALLKKDLILTVRIQATFA